MPHMKQFTDPSVVSDDHYYIYLYPTKMPRVTTSVLRQLQGRVEDRQEGEHADRALVRRVFRLPLGHKIFHDHLYSEEELASLRGGYLHYIAPMIQGQQMLALGKREFRGLLSGLKEFFDSGNPDAPRKSPSRRAEPFHPFLSYFNWMAGPNTSVVLNPMAMKRTVDDLTSDRVKSRETELLEFLRQHKPGAGLDEVYLAFRDAVVRASLLDGSIGLIKEVPHS